MISGLQAAIYSALDAALSYPVYDHVPQDESTPYVKIGNATDMPFDTDEDTGFETTVTVHAHSEYLGKKEVQNMQAAIYDALHRAELTVSGYHVLDVQQEFSEMLDDDDGISRHGVQRFRIYIEKL